jgi:hypothetical protein
MFIAISFIGILLIASPVLAEIHFPSTEQFSEIYLLGPNQMATDIPFNVNTSQTYTVYLGVGNHLDSSAYYVSYVKIRNQTESFPSEKDQTPSSLSPVHEYRLFLENNQNLTYPLVFSFKNVDFSNNQAVVKTLSINGLDINLSEPSQFDSENQGYYYQFIVELWAVNPLSTVTQYQNRYVYFWVNVTSPV